MPVDNYTLPRDPKRLARIIDQHAEREEARISYRRTMWLLAWYYIQGYRRFDVFDPTSGRVTPHYLDEEGNMEFQSQEFLSALDRVTGRIAAMDLRPRVHRQGMSLPAIRDRAVGQILLDAQVSETQLEPVKTQFAHLFGLLGSAGITGHLVDHPTVGLTTDLEVIHPREIYPFPSLGEDYTKQRGIMRERYVPLDWLKKKYGRRVADNLGDMYWYEQEVGEVIGHDDEEAALYGGSSFEYMAGGGSSFSPEAKTTMGLVQVRELWTDGPRDTCSRYVVASGDYIIEDNDYEGLEVYCPIGFARFIESSTFHGLGLFDLLFPIARQLELNLKSLFNNIRDIDRYGVLVIPQGQFNERQMLREVGQGLRILPWDPDPIHEGFRPFSITPHNAGDVPGKTAAFARDLMTGINPVQDLIQEKGRVDSAAGLSFLDEQVNRAMTNPSRGVEHAFSQAYRSVLNQTGKHLARSPRAIPVGKLTLDLAGAIIDPDSMEVSFSENPLPTTSQLHMSIRERSPRSEVARKQEAIQIFKDLEGLTDPDALKLFALKEGLDFAMWMDDYQAAYETVVRNILLLYGDGVNPGQIIVTPHTSKPEIQLRVLESFMTGPVMAIGSPEVIDEFKRYREFLIESLGLMLPAAVPNPDDVAILNEAVSGALPPPQMEGSMNGQQMVAAGAG
jgi:hypothetical protein